MSDFKPTDRIGFVVFAEKIMTHTLPPVTEQGEQYENFERHLKQAAKGDLLSAMQYDARCRDALGIPPGDWDETNRDWLDIADDIVRDGWINMTTECEGRSRKLHAAHAVAQEGKKQALIDNARAQQERIVLRKAQFEKSAEALSEPFAPNTPDLCILEEDIDDDPDASII